jgi:ArsR family transcriptional regulator
MKSMDQVLEIVGNGTRRKILAILSEEPCYISEISKKLDVTQPAILKQLSILEKAGLIDSFWRKSPLGAARKYYRICDSLGIEIAINPKGFTVNKRTKDRNCYNYSKKEQAIKRLTEEINKADTVATKAAKARELMTIADSLLSCAQYEKGNWNCENCHRVASLRKQASQIILHISSGDTETGLRELTEAINQLAEGLLPTRGH